MRGPFPPLPNLHMSRFFCLARFMQPGTPHIVYTLTPTFTVGGHFYSRYSFQQTLHGLVLCNALGTQLTNIDHPHSLIILYKLFAKYVHEYSQFKKGQENQDDTIGACLSR